MMAIVLMSIICTIISPAWALVGGITHSPPIFPEIPSTHLSKVSQLVSTALGDAVVIDDDTGNEDASIGRYAFADTGSKVSSSSRYTLARDAVSIFQSDNDDNESPSSIPQNELVYGELSVPTLATILDAVGVQNNDVFLDIGSGDGALVLGASLLYATNDSSSDGDIYEEKSGGERRRRNAIQKCYGVDIVPGLVNRSIVHAKNLEMILQSGDNVQTTNGIKDNQSEMHFLLGDIHIPDKHLQHILQETTLAVCFATTWSAGNANNDSNEDKRRSTSLQGRRLPKLSSSLSTSLSSGCRVVIIDGKLSEEDGFTWQGDLKIICPDTAPHSIATLYYKQ